MEAPIYNEEHRRLARLKVVETARDILSGKLGIIAGARQLAGWRFDLGAENDPDFIYFVGLDSETDDLPIGKVRSGWNSEALREKDQQIQAFEVSAREKTFHICRNLIQKYDNPEGSANCSG